MAQKITSKIYLILLMIFFSLPILSQNRETSVVRDVEEDPNQEQEVKEAVQPDGSIEFVEELPVQEEEVKTVETTPIPEKDTEPLVQEIEEEPVLVVTPPTQESDSIPLVQEINDPITPVIVETVTEETMDTIPVGHHKEVVVIREIEEDSKEFNETFVSNNSMIRPANLRVGDTITIVSPAGKIKDRASIEQAIELANEWGLVVFLGNHLLSEDNTYAGTDTERREDLQDALDNPSIKAIWAARGGYGTVRIIDALDFTKFQAHPKWVIGYSDITVLHNKIHNLGIETIHGEMPLTLDLENPEKKGSFVTLHRALFGGPFTYGIKSSEFNRKGESTGQLVGGNLTLISQMLASDTDLDMEGKVLFIEDIDEELYSIDRMMISLKRAGYFEKCNGLVVGDFKMKENDENKFGKSLEEIVLEATEGTNFPIIFNFPAGHTVDNRALILGDEVKLIVTEKYAEIIFK